MMNQTDPDGYPVAITPRILLVPNALAVSAATVAQAGRNAGEFADLGQLPIRGSEAPVAVLAR